MNDSDLFFKEAAIDLDKINKKLINKPKDASKPICCPYYIKDSRKCVQKKKS